MRAGAEGQAGVQAHHRGIIGARGLGQLVVPGHDPGAAAEAHRLELVQPGALPILVLDGFQRGPRPVQRRVRGREGGLQRIGIGIAIEQRAQHHLPPGRGFAHARLEDRLFVGRLRIRILQGDRERAGRFQHGLAARLLVLRNRDRKLQPGHQPNLSERSRLSARRFSR